MKKDTEFRTVRYVFSSEETAQHSNELAEACRTKQETENEKKSVMSNFKAKIDSQDSRIGLLSKYITTGYDYRSVECVVKKNFDTRMVEYYYQGELVDSRQFSEHDSQLELQ